MLILIKFEDLKDHTLVKKDVPNTVYVGSKLDLSLTLKRKNKGRSEELHIQGPYQVNKVTTEIAAGSQVRQLVEVTSLGAAPSWKAVKNPPYRPLAPLQSPRTKLS